MILPRRLIVAVVPGALVLGALVLGAPAAGAQTAPSTPQGVGVEPGNRSLTVSWQEPASDGGAAVDGYVVRHKLSSDDDLPTSWTRVDHTTLTDLSMEITGLTEWQSYDVQVAAANPNDEGAFSATVTGTPNRDIPVTFWEDQDIESPSGMWSDGTILWITDFWHNRARAFNLDTGDRVAGRDLDTHRDPDHLHHAGIWSDGDTAWITGAVDIVNGNLGHIKVYAYVLATGQRDASKDISGLAALGNRSPRGLWADDTTMWILDAEPFTPHQDKIYAHRRSDGAHQPELDFQDIWTRRTQVVLRDATSIWSDGGTMWVARCYDAGGRKSRIHAYSMATQGRVPSRDIDVHAAGDTCPQAIWSDGTSMLTAGDYTEDGELPGRIFSYPLPPAAAPKGLDPSNREAFVLDLIGGNEILTVRWTGPVNDGGSAVTSYEVQHKESSEADLPQNWTDAAHSDLDDLSVRIESLTIGVDYDVRIRAVNAAGPSPWVVGTTTPTRDFNSLVGVDGGISSRLSPRGLWSDGVTMWVSQSWDSRHGGDTRPAQRKVYGYDFHTTERTPSLDFNVIPSRDRGDPDYGAEDTDAGRTFAQGMWSDNNNMWVVELHSPTRILNRMQVYRLADGQKLDREYNLYAGGQLQPYGVWSDGETVWVSDSVALKLFAYDLDTRARLPERDFNTLRAVGGAPKGIWSDGDTMWVANNGKLYAYSMATTQRVPERDIEVRDRRFDLPVRSSGGLYSDGDVIWVTGSEAIHAVDLPDAVAPKALEDFVVRPANEALVVEWSRPGNDGGSAVTSYEVQHKESSEADLPQNWTDAAHSDLDDLSVQINNLSNGTSYDVRARAVNRVNDGEWSRASAVPRVPKPESPHNLRAVPGVGVFTVFWEESPGNRAPVTSYQVQYRVGGGAWQDLAHSDLANLSVRFSATNGRTYDVQVRGVNAVGEGPWGTVSGTPSNNFGSLIDSGNVFNFGIWSNGTTMWVGDALGKIYAYDLFATVHDSSKDIALAAGTAPSGGIWSNGVTMWVLDAVRHNILAYMLTNGQRDATKDISTLDPGNTNPFGLWSDGTTLWIGDSGADGKLYAYTLATGVRDQDKDFDDLSVTGIRIGGIASDGETLWVADGQSSPRANLYAYSLDTRGRVPRRDVGLGLGGAPTGLWADTSTVWVSTLGQLVSRDLPSKSAPRAPGGFAADPRDEQVMLSWSKPSDDGGSPVTSFDVQYRTKSPQGAWSSVARSVAAALTETIGAPLFNDTAYDFEVRAVNSVGPGPWARVSATPRSAATKPSAPRGLVASGGDLSITMSWSLPLSDGGADITIYEVQHRVKSPQGPWVPATVGAPDTSVTVTVAANDVTYEVQVRARNRVGTSGWIRAEVFPETPDTTPGAPQAASVTAGHRRLTVMWAEPADNGGDPVSHYLVDFRRQSPPGAWTRAARTDPAALAETVTPLDNDVAYDIRIAAVNDVGRGAWLETSGTPRARLPGAPADLRVTRTTAESMSLSWSRPGDDGGADIMGYMVRYRPEGQPDAWTDVSRSDSTALTETIASLGSGATYVVQVAAVNVAGRGDWADLTERASSTAARAEPGGGVGVGGSVGGGVGGGEAAEPDDGGLMFEDVAARDYFAVPVSWMVDNSITSGCAPGRFCPARPVTRQEFVTFLWRAAGRPTVTTPGSAVFADVMAGSYADDAIGWAAQSAVTLGCRASEQDALGRFCPSAEVSRGQLATLLYRYVVGDSDRAAPSETRFSDVDSGSFYASAVAWMVTHGITTGCSAEMFCPHSIATRAQAATFMWRISTTPESWGIQGILRTPTDS